MRQKQDELRDVTLTIQELSSQFAQAILEKNGWRAQAEKLASEIVEKDKYIAELEETLNDEMNEPNCIENEE